MVIKQALNDVKKNKILEEKKNVLSVFSMFSNMWSVVYDY